MKTVISTEVVFGREGNASEFQLYGWFRGEKGFTWTLDADSGLCLPKPSSRHGGILEISLIPLTRAPAPRSQRLTIHANGRCLGSTSLSLPACLGFYFGPPSVYDQHFVVGMSHPDCLQQGGPGSLRFAFAVQNVRILELQEPMPPHTLRTSGTQIGQEAEEDIGSIIATIERIAGVTILDFLTSFQLVAGDCEFGGLQRACGCDPLGLFRFAGASVEAAIKALDNSLLGIGEHLDPFVVEHGGREWMIKDLQYNLVYHTGMSAAAFSADEVVTAEKRKIAFLRRKFLAELTEREKTFVCADRFGSPLEAMLPLFLALNRYGPNKLLWVTRASDKADVGKAEEVLPGLMVGYIEEFMQYSPSWRPGSAGWLSVLVNAWKLQH